MKSGKEQHGTKLIGDGIPVVSLFSGAGGMDLGFVSQGFAPILAIDIDEAAIATYNHNLGSARAKQGDLSKLSGKDIIALLERHSPGIRPRGVIGGPPCQSFSRSNVHGTSADPRHKLPFHYAEILHELNLRYHLDFFVFENVVGLTSTKHVRRYRKILKALADAGFVVYEGLLDAAEFGVPQHRKRIFVVGINKELHPNVEFVFPKGGSGLKTVRQAIGGLPLPTFYRRGIKPSEIRYHPNHWTMKPKSQRFSTSEHNVKWRSFRRLQWNKPSLTIAYGHREIFVHPTGGRRLSIYESMLLQGFPKRYQLLGNLSQQVSEVSNAVPPPLAKAIAKVVRRRVYDPLREIRCRLLDWFEIHRRHFPWRESRDPYAILIAEKLLQQTSAREAVVTAYHELLRRYPNLVLLAEAKPQDIEAIITPLGFKYRAAELLRLARILLSEHGGIVPDRLTSLLKLPGVGDYSARAVLSFAFGQSVPIVDTNVARLLFRLFGLSGKFPSNPARNRYLIELASTLIPSGDTKDFNLAVLDFCAALCTRANPKCTECPLRNLCCYGAKTTKQLKV